MDATAHIPVVSFVGASNSGKTTLVEKVVHDLAGRGFTVATVKHHLRDLEVDTPGKDSWRHARAGAAITCVASPDQFTLMKRVSGDTTLARIAAEAAMAGASLLVAEGFKGDAADKIEVSRVATGARPRFAASELVGLAADDPALAREYARANPALAAFPLDEGAAVAAFIVDRYLSDKEVVHG